jgi:TfoX/Sxy family transcriptional regulator of competence genes
LNGNMFSFMSNNGRIGIRLPEKEREEFLKKYKSELFNTHGTVMKEYVTVPESLHIKTNELSKYFELSYEMAKSLKPKPSAKKKK